MLISLLISACLIPIVLTTFNIIEKQLSFDEEIQDIVTINQLRRILIVSYDKEINYDHMTFTFHNQQHTLGLINRKLIMKPGTRIFLIDVDDVFFEEDADKIYIEYKRKEKSYVQPLCLKN